MSKSIIDDLANNAATVFISQVRKTLLPAISVKYNIPIEELCLLVDSTQKDNLPNKIVAKKSSANISEKIMKSKANNKFYNITTGRDLVDNPGNRKKYVFNDALNIAASKDDSNFAVMVEKLQGSSATMSNTSKEQEPEQSPSNGKIVAKRKVKKPEPAQEPEPVNDDETAAPIHVQASAAKNKGKKATLTEDAAEPVEEPKKEKEIAAVYHKTLKVWYTPKKMYLVQKSVPPVIYGKINGEDQIEKLSDQDVEFCNKKKWNVDCTLLDGSVSEESEAED